MGSTGGGNGKPGQYTCCETSGTFCIKGQKDMTPKDESPRLEGVKWQPTPLFLPGEIPGTEEPGGLPSMGSHRVRHD